MKGLGNQQLTNVKTTKFKKPTQEQMAIAFGKNVRTIRR